MDIKCFEHLNIFRTLAPPLPPPSFLPPALLTYKRYLRTLFPRERSLTSLRAAGVMYDNNENSCQGFGEAIAASMFSAPGLVRGPLHGSTAAATLVPPILPMLRLPYTHAPFHHPSPYSSYDPLAYRLAPMPLASHLPVVAPPLHHPAAAPSRAPAPGNGVAPPSSSVARTREGRYPSG